MRANQAIRVRGRGPGAGAVRLRPAPAAPPRRRDRPDPPRSSSRPRPWKRHQPTGRSPCRAPSRSDPSLRGPGHVAHDGGAQVRCRSQHAVWRSVATSMPRTAGSTRMPSTQASVEESMREVGDRDDPSRLRARLAVGGHGGAAVRARLRPWRRGRPRPRRRPSRPRPRRCSPSRPRWSVANASTASRSPAARGGPRRSRHAGRRRGAPCHGIRASAAAGHRVTRPPLERASRRGRSGSWRP